MNIEILVVEDDEQICGTVKRFLSNAGFHVDTCFDGDKAWEQIYNKKYHLIILDIMLPGMNGQELLREARKISDAPVLMMTALDDDDSQLRAFNNLADDYVTKPFKTPIAAMSALIEEMIEGIAEDNSESLRKCMKMLVAQKKLVSEY